MFTAKKERDGRMLRSVADIVLSRRRRGDWGAWKTCPFDDPGEASPAWLRQFTIRAQNDVWTVMLRPIDDVDTHAVVTWAYGDAPTPAEIRRIAREIVGPDANAFTLAPPDPWDVSPRARHVAIRLGPSPFLLPWST